MSQGAIYVVWVVGSEAGWHSTLVAAFDDRDAAIECARREAAKGCDPGDTVIVDGLVLNDPDADAEEVWRWTDDGAR